MKGSAYERCRYRAACRDSAIAYNNTRKPMDWRVSVRGSFPNLHMRRKCPCWLRDCATKKVTPYGQRRAEAHKRRMATMATRIERELLRDWSDL